MTIDQPVAPLKRRPNGKRKGGNFENHVSKLLSEKLAPMKFRRSQSSGAIIGGANERFMEHFSDDARTLFVGDVVPTNEADVMRSDGWKLRFTLECKFYKTADNIEHLLSNTKIRSWFEQAARDASKIVDKTPLLIFKFNHTEIFAAVDSVKFPVEQHPKNISRFLTLKFPSLDDQSERTITVFYLKELLQDLDWWKINQRIS